MCRWIGNIRRSVLATSCETVLPRCWSPRDPTVRDFRLRAKRLISIATRRLSRQHPTDNAAKRRASRGALPAHLPRIEVTLAPEDTKCPCCQAAMTVIGEDTFERLDVIPAQYRVIVTKRPKLACRACAGTVVQAPAPARLIEGGIPTEALVAHVLVARYADHLPLDRGRGPALPRCLPKNHLSGDTLGHPPQYNQSAVSPGASDRRCSARAFPLAGRWI